MYIPVLGGSHALRGFIPRRCSTRHPSTYAGHGWSFAFRASFSQRWLTTLTHVTGEPSPTKAPSAAATMVRNQSLEMLIGSLDVEMSHTSNLLSQSDFQKVQDPAPTNHETVEQLIPSSTDPQPIHVWHVWRVATTARGAASSSLPVPRLGTALQHHGTRNLAPHVHLHFTYCATTRTALIHDVLCADSIVGCGRTALRSLSLRTARNTCDAFSACGAFDWGLNGNVANSTRCLARL